ncbi:MAG: nucleoside hydrolase [Bianqueaceae bacterium]
MVAIGAITNVASAILIEPAIIDHIVVVWLGGHVVTMESNQEFNLCGDLLASQYIFDCGVPLIHMPCFGVTSHLLTTVPDLEACLRGKNALCDMLCHRVADFTSDPFGWAKEIWDVGAVAYLVNPGWFDSRIMPCPRITDDCHWAWDENRHSFRTCFLKPQRYFPGSVYKIGWHFRLILRETTRVCRFNRVKILNRNVENFDLFALPLLS